jgi:hypothetical protein
VICGFDSRPRHLRTCDDWALASLTGRNPAIPEDLQVQLLLVALEMARSSIGTGRQTLDLARRVRLPHGLLNSMTKWRNWQTRDAQNVVPLRHGSSILPLVTETLQARQVPNWLS